MTTSLTKSTIPAYIPNDDYASPRVAPRVKFEGRENFLKNRGSFNLGDWAAQGKNWESPRPTLKLKYEEAFKAYKRNTEGSMKELLGGYCENPPIAKTGPRVTKDALENYRKNRGSFHSIIGSGSGYGSNDSTAGPAPRVFREGASNEEKNRRGEVGELLSHYGHMPLSAQPVPRVKFGGQDVLAHQRGSSVEKTLKMVPPSSRPSSSQFFNKYN